MEIWSGGLFERRRPYIDRVHSVSMTADERRAVSGGEYTTRVWDLETGTCLHSVDEGGDASVTPDGQHAVSGGDRLKVWNMHTGDHLRDLDIPSSHIGISADGRTALAAHGTKIRVLDLEKGRCPLGSDHHEGRVRIVAVSLNGRRAISVGDDDALRVWDTQTGDCLRTVKLTRGETSFHVPVYLSVDARWAVSDHGLNLRLWDLDEGKCAGIYRLRLSWLKRLKHFLSSNQSSWMCAPAELDTGLSRQ
jgi:WD40 repeat protein